MRAKQCCIPAIVVTLMAGPAALHAQTPIGTAFAYQGQLKQAGVPVSDTADFEFTLWDAATGGNQVGSMVPVNGWPIENGLFTLVLNFGWGIFTGDARWLEIAVRVPSGGGTFTTLSPRQELTPTPHALYAVTAGPDDDWMVSGNDMYAMPFGNVGIGDSTPDAKLDVEGSAMIAEDVYVGDTSNKVRKTTGGAMGIYAGQWLQYYIGGTQRAYLGVDRFCPLANDAMLLGQSDRRWKELWLSGDATIGGNGHVYGSTEIDGNAQIDGSAQIDGNAYIDGLVGIGTVYPDGKLDVVVDGHDRLAIRGFSGMGGAYFSDTDGTSFASVAVWANGIDAYGDEIGIIGTGNTCGGEFWDNNSSATADVAKDTYKISGTGSVDFVQNHPEDLERVIVYACLEGDEVATYTRGTARLASGVARVPLGDTFKWVTNPDIGLSAHLTPRADCRGLYVASLTTSEMVVRELGGGTSAVTFDYIVYGLRIGFEEVSIVQEKQREAYIPSMASHRERYEKNPELRQYNALERFDVMRNAIGDTEPLNLSASRALRDAIIEFDPALHELPRSEPPRFETTCEDNLLRIDTPADSNAVDAQHAGAYADPAPESVIEALREIVTQQDTELDNLRARLVALEALVAELANP